MPWLLLPGCIDGFNFLVLQDQLEYLTPPGFRYIDDKIDAGIFDGPVNYFGIVEIVDEFFLSDESSLCVVCAR